MAEVDVEAKKWGDSVAVIIPKSVALSENILPKDHLHISIKKEDDLREFFGRFKTKKTPQQLKNESKHDWE